MRNLSEICLVAIMVSLSVNVARLLSGEILLRNTVMAALQHKPLGLLHQNLATVKRLTPEDARPFLLFGQELFAAAISNAAESRETLLVMSEYELTESVRRNPADGAAWLSLALVTSTKKPGLDAGERSSQLARKAVQRRPGFAESAWVYARSLPRGSDTQAGAYRLTTRLEPRLTPKIIQEISFMASEVTAQTRYVAPLASCYRYWAWSVTSTVDGPLIANLGLQHPSTEPDQTRIDHAWLHYYLGLKFADAAKPVLALPWFERALTEMTTEQAFYRNYGFALLKAGAPRKAAEEFRSSIALYPDLANASHLGLAQASEALGEKASAMAIYRRLSANPRIESWVREAAGGGMYRLENTR